MKPYRFFIITFFAVTFVLGTICPITAQETKFGRVSFIDVQKNSRKVISAMDEIQKMQADSQTKIDGLRRDLKKIEDQLQKPDVTADQRSKLEKEIEDKQQEISTEEQGVRIKTAIRQKSVQGAIGQQIKTIIDNLAKEEGYAAIFRTELLLYADGLTDLTEKITKALDAAPALEIK